jgi:uncharacterized membrane protein
MSPVDRRRTAFALFFVAAGLVHLVAPEVYRGIMPPALPHPKALIYTSGAAEILGGIGLLVPVTRRAAGLGLILLLLAVFPANVQMLSNWRARGASWWAETLLWLRLPLQLVFIVWAWRFSRTSKRIEQGRSE